ncbi:hypothetical protein AADZ84_15435 [Colwelliaceae bacterium MEBiC 14330]
MHSIKSKSSEAVTMLTASSVCDKNSGEAADKSTENSLKVNFPFSFLLVENEEDCFVKGYN